MLIFVTDTERKKGEGEATIEDYETAFNEIEEITGTNDISAIVEDFIKGIIHVAAPIEYLQQVFF